LETVKVETVLTMLTITAGVAVASYGEVLFNVTGVMYMLGSILAESIRVVLVQVLLQKEGLKLNPVTSMLYIFPVSFIFLLPPWLAIEGPKFSDIFSAEWMNARSGIVFVTNAGAAFVLNCSTFLLIGHSSALTMNVAGVVKDLMLVYLSWALFGSPITSLNIVGYSTAILAAGYYNYTKLRDIHEVNKPVDTHKQQHGVETDGTSDALGRGERVFQRD
jgi:hypothetical protein